MSELLLELNKIMNLCADKVTRFRLRGNYEKKTKDSQIWLFIGM